MTTAGRTFTIGTLSRMSGCSVDTLRYYERLGLMPGVARTEGKHRLYNGEHVRRLGFIRRSRALGLSLTQVRALLDGIEQRDLDCGKARSVLEKQLSVIRHRVAEFQKLERDLHGMVEACRGAAEPSCDTTAACCRVIESWCADNPRRASSQLPR